MAVKVAGVRWFYVEKARPGSISLRQPWPTQRLPDACPRNRRSRAWPASLKKLLSSTRWSDEVRAFGSCAACLGGASVHRNGSHRKEFGYIGRRARSGTLSMTPDILVKHVALSGAEGLCDIGIANGHFVSIGQNAASSNAGLTLDAEGRMAVSGFVEPHIHLDKALISERAPVNISGTLTEAIEILWNIKRNYTVDEIADRASRVLERALESGIFRLRTHVDVDPIGGTRPAEGLIRARDRFRDLIDIQIVAFPQHGIVKSPGTEALMAEVMKSGVDVVGAMPFNEVSPQDSRRHIEIVFDIARQFDADIDMHVDETDDPMPRTLEVLAELTIANGWQGRVTAGHTCARARYPRNYAEHVIGRLRQATATMSANTATILMLHGRLRQ